MSNLIKQIKIQNESGGVVATPIGVDIEHVILEDGSNLGDKFVDFEGATASQGGSAGLVPAPASADREKFLRGDGTWQPVESGTTITVDDALSLTSENPVQNAVITTALNSKAATADLSTVATTGSYNDLTNKPTIPTKLTDLTNDGNFVTDANYTHIDVDAALSATSENPIQNKIIKTALDNKVDTSLIGTANGIAELDASGHISTSQLPGSVDEVVEYASLSNFPSTGESEKIYIALDTNLTYRWSGSTYAVLNPSLALGETSSTAYRGDRGKIAYDHATEAAKINTPVASGLYKIAATAEGHIASTTAVTKADITTLGIPAQDTTYTANTTSINNASGWSAGTLTSFTVDDEDEALVITPGTLPQITLTATQVATGITAD